MNLDIKFDLAPHLNKSLSIEDFILIKYDDVFESKFKLIEQQISQDISGCYYELLLYLSDQFKNETFLDLGTYRGHSALAMALNGENTVLSYDVTNCLQCSYSDFKNIQFFLDDIKNIDDKTILKSKLIFLDIDHCGNSESNFLDRLRKLGWSGLVVCDDIILNDEMRDFWAKIPEPKIDLTSVFHKHGTGIINFTN